MQVSVVSTIGEPFTKIAMGKADIRKRRGKFAVAGVACGAMSLLGAVLPLLEPPLFRFYYPPSWLLSVLAAVFGIVGRQSRHPTLGWSAVVLGTVAVVTAATALGLCGSSNRSVERGYVVWKTPTLGSVPSSQNVRHFSYNAKGNDLRRRGLAPHHGRPRSHRHAVGLPESGPAGIDPEREALICLEAVQRLAAEARPGGPVAATPPASPSDPRRLEVASEPPKAGRPDLVLTAAGCAEAGRRGPPGLWPRGCARRPGRAGARGRPAAWVNPAPGR